MEGGEGVSSFAAEKEEPSRTALKEEKEEAPPRYGEEEDRLCDKGGIE